MNNTKTKEKKHKMNRTFKLTASAVIIAVIALACTASALTFDNIDIEAWVGTGASSAVCVVDFGANSYAFGYRFDGAATGFDMLQAIAAGTALDLGYTDWGWGYSIDRLAYGPDAHEFDINNPDTSNWWEYWTSTDGANWSSSNVGVGGRTLTDNSWDGWTWSPAWPGVGAAPNVPTVPEPGSIAALAAGLGTFLIRRKR